MRDKKTLAVLASREEDLRTFQANLGDAAISVLPVPSPEQLWGTLCETPCIGLAVSLSSLVRAPETVKTVLREIDHIIPVAKFKADPIRGTIGIMSSAGAGAGMEEFLRACMERGPKRFRKHERFRKHVNIILGTDPGFLEREPSFTFDISRDGCFAHTDHEWKEGTHVWISVREPFREFAVEGVVVRYVPWGVPFQPQGIGIRFLEPGCPGIVRLIRYISPARSPRVDYAAV